MRFLISLTVSLWAVGALFVGAAGANTIEFVDRSWAARGPEGEALQNVRTAVDVATSLALKAETVVAQVKLYNKAATAALWVGDHTDAKPDKIAIYEKGLNLAQAGVDLLTGKEGELSTTERHTLAEAYLNYTSNRGRWGETRGILKSLKYAPEMKRIAQKVIDLGHEDIFDYGAHRTLGRVFFKLPSFAGGNNQKAYEHLKIAFDNTQYKDLGISRHGLNNIYYADTLRKVKKDLPEACRIVKTFVEQKATDLHPDRVPETLDEQKNGTDDDTTGTLWLAKHCSKI